MTWYFPRFLPQFGQHGVRTKAVRRLGELGGTPNAGMTAKPA
ncbi:hypothetical protein [Paeniglutamicibacter psychrophenolicus]|nr:hypothetical protein [Paeniglutamicibacter psychrophenolicus]MDQ0093042.1 hypothetical protein [Paeniglutamicibacter psychrophenolicus]